MPQRKQQTVFVHADRLVGLIAQNVQIYRVEGDLREDTGEDRGDTELGMKKSGAQSAEDTNEDGGEDGQKGRLAGKNKHDRYGAARGEGSVHGQVGELKNAEADIQPQRHDSPDDPLSQISGERGDKRSDV